MLATKFGIVRAEGARPINGRPEYVRAACDASLKRLRLETIDLYYQHRVARKPDRGDRRRDGRTGEPRQIRSLSLSKSGPETIRGAVAIHLIAALQSEYCL